MNPFLQDRDFTLHVGDVREILPRLDAGSVDCVVTSPPYWGLRDYNAVGQIGLEATPDLYVAEMVAVFRQVRRLLAPHGTCWINLGDSYASGGGLGAQGASGQMADRGIVKARRPGNPDKNGGNSNRDGVPCPPGLKPKDLVGIPWRVAFALQADGWYLRSDIVWSKPNPMPESVTDRPTKSHEYVFLLTKQPRYFFDQEAVREQHTDTNGSRLDALRKHGTSTTDDRVQNNGPHAVQVFHRGLPGVGTTAGGWNPAGRNVRSVWEIATQPYPEAHFATFPEALPERCIKAGCPEQVCATCGKPRERIVERAQRPWTADTRTPGAHTPVSVAKPSGAKAQEWIDANPPQTFGWSDCGHGSYRPGVVLDPFMGSGTVALVARRLGRRSVGVELSPEYAALAARRLQQLSLLAEASA